MRGTGLNQKASEIRTRLGSHPPSRATAAARAAKSGSGLKKAAELRLRLGSYDSGMNAEDRREIESEIEGIVLRDRMSAAPKDFSIRPTRKGFVFPLIVNLVALALTVGAVTGLASFFGKKDQGVASASGSVVSAEGILLQELKRDSESKLQEKDRAIAGIRERMGSLDKERSELAGTIDARVKQRETEIKASLQAELEAEKRRLGGQGLSETAVQARLKAFENAKAGESARLLEAERSRAAAEISAADANYTKLKEEYQKSISGLGEERARIQDESRKREDALRIAMEAKNKELESRSAAAEASLATAMSGLEKASAELAALADRKAKAQAFDDRVLGLYAAIRSAFRDGRYADAASGSASLAAFLGEPAASTNPQARDRRAADLFVAQTIGAYARSELERSGADATMLLRQAELLEAARESSSSASKALKEGNSALAAAKYREALEKVPEILAAHEYFLGRERDAEAARRLRLNEALAAGERAMNAKDAQAAAARYAEALFYLPIAAPEREALLSRLEGLGSAEADAARAASDSKAARPLLDAALRNVAASRWAEAIAGCISLLSAYPLAQQAPAALGGIEAARAGMQRDFDAEMAASKAAARREADSLGALSRQAEAKAASLSSELATARTALEAARSNAAGAAAQARASDAELRARIADLEKRLKDQAEETGRAAAAANPAVEAAVLAAKDGEIAALKAEAQRLKDEASRAASESADARGLAGKYRALTESYARYLSRDAGNPIAAQSGLYSFLGGQEVAGAFPGLREKVSGYQALAQSESLDAFPSDAAEIVRQAYQFKDKAARGAYLASRREAYSAGGNELMSNFIDAVAKSLN